MLSPRGPRAAGVGMDEPDDLAPLAEGSASFRWIATIHFLAINKAVGQPDHVGEVGERAVGIQPRRCALNGTSDSASRAKSAARAEFGLHTFGASSTSAGCRRSDRSAGMRTPTLSFEQFLRTLLPLFPGEAAARSAVCSNTGMDPQKRKLPSKTAGTLPKLLSSLASATRKGFWSLRRETAI